MSFRILLAICCGLIGAVASAEETPQIVVCPSHLEGRFTSEFQLWEDWTAHNYAQFIRNADGSLEMELLLSCGTKTNPRRLRVICEKYGRNTLEILEEGSSQCDLGVQPSMQVIEDRLIIHTSIEVPGFDGNYELEREAR